MGKEIATRSVIRYALSDDRVHKYWIGKVVTDSAFRGQGIAKSLISRCVSVAKERGLR